MGGPLAHLHCSGQGRDPFVTSTVLDDSFAAGQGGRAPCVKCRGAAVDLGGWKREKVGRRPVTRWEQVAGPGCHGRASRRLAPAGLVSSAGQAAADMAPVSTVTWPTAAVLRVDEAQGRLTAFLGREAVYALASTPPKGTCCWDQGHPRQERRLPAAARGRLSPRNEPGGRPAAENSALGLSRAMCRSLSGLGGAVREGTCSPEGREPGWGDLRAEGCPMR